MRVRAVTVVAALLVAVLGLSACQTNVGSAADIDGQRVSESQVSTYLTADAKPVAGGTGSSQIPIRSFVVEVLLRAAYLQKLLAATPEGLPDPAHRAALERQLLAGHDLRQLLAMNGIRGYSDSFNQRLLDLELYSTLLSREEQAGVDVDGYVKKLSFSASVNPRYGKLDVKTFSLDSAPGAGVPDYLTLQSAKSTTAGQ